MRIIRIAPLLLALAACSPPRAPAPAASPRPAPGIPEIRFDHRGDTLVITDTLPNGLVYYVRRNAEPRNRAELRLVVNVGSVLEDDDQRGLAHFLEHMAFNGTRRFARNEIIDYLERVGMRFGPDVNATTSFDETVYMLQLPTDSAGVLDTGLTILEHWATGIALDSAEIEAERGVVIEEWRRWRGAGARVSDRQFPFLFAGSRYAERSPIGDPETIRTFSHETLRRFYYQWYRPELMAVVAVGDFDPAEMERKIREVFGAIPALGGPERPEIAVPARDSARVIVTVDPEIPSTALTVNWLRPARRDWSPRGFRAGLVESMFAGMLGDRLNDISLLPDAPFLDVGSYLGGSLRPVETFSLNAAVPQGGVERGLAAVLAEVERAARHGFTPAELEREKAEFLRMWEQIYAERHKTTSGQYAGQYADHYLRGGLLRTLEEEWVMLNAYLPGITVEDANEVARGYAAMRDRTVLVTAPEHAGAALPDERRLAAIADSVARAPVTPYRETPSEAPLLAQLPAAGSVVSEEFVPEAGITRWTLSNGAQVVLKPTDFQDDQVLFAATSPGGLSLLPDSLYLHGRLATAAVQVGGVGALGLTELQRRLAGKAASVGTTIGELYETVNGYAAPRDVETMFQLVHLYFTAPRRDTAAWEAFRQRGREMLRNRGATPESAFGDTLTAVLTRRHPRTRPFTAAMYDSLDLDRAITIYRQRYANAGDFTFFLVGSFQPDEVRPLVERYLASLPASETRERWRDPGIRPPAGVVEKTVRRGVEPKARTTLYFTGPAQFSREARSEITSLADALEIRLRERLREQLGGTYGVTVSANVSRDPVPQYVVAIDFNTDPERLNELTRVTFAEIDSLRAGGVPADVVQKVREAHRRSKEISLRQNDVWLTALLEYQRLGWDVRTIDDAPLSATLTPERIRAAARLYLNRRRYVRVSLVPEN